MCIRDSNNRDFKIQRRGRQREHKKKTIGLISKTTTSHLHHTFLYISFPFLLDYDVKMPNFAFYGGRKQAKTKFSFSFWAWIWSLEIQLGGFPYNWQSKWAGIIGIKTEKTQIHFLSDVLVAVASLDLKVPIVVFNHLLCFVYFLPILIFCFCHFFHFLQTD